jgi:hypothetical protein
MTESKEAFVIIPFAPEFDRVYDRVIKPTCEDLGYEVSKADSTDTQQNILRDVITGIANADLLIADLTDSNANVFYEAGVADGLGIPTVLITQSIDSVPFDLQAYNMIEYSTDFVEIEEFESELRNIGEKHLNGEIEFGSPITDFTDIDIDIPSGKDGESTESDRMTEADEGEEASEASKESPEPEKGVLDYAAEAESAQLNFVNSVSEITSQMSTLEMQLSDHAERINAISNSQEQIAPTRAKRLTRRAANDIKGYASSVSDDTESIEDNLTVMMNAEESFINFADPTDKEHRKALKERQEGLKEFRSSTGAATEGLEEFYYEATQVKGLDRELNRAVNELTDILSDLISTLTGSEARAERMIQLIEQKLSE